MIKKISGMYVESRIPALEDKIRKFLDHLVIADVEVIKNGNVLITLKGNNKLDSNLNRKINELEIVFKVIRGVRVINDKEKIMDTW